MENLEVPKVLGKNEITAFKEAIKKTDIEEIEGETAKYVKDVFDMVRKRGEFVSAIEDAVLSKLDQLTPTQLIALLGNTGVNFNDLTNKALAPTAQLLTERQRTEAAKAAAQAQIAQTAASLGSGSEMKVVAQGAGQEILTGMRMLAEMLQQANTKALSDAEVIEN